MKAKLITLVSLMLIGSTAMAQTPGGNPPATQQAPAGDKSAAHPGKATAMEGQRVYQLLVREERDKDSIQAFNRGLNSSGSNRGLLSGIVESYRQTFAGQAVTLTTGLIEMGVTAIVNAASDKRQKWEQAVRNESTFVRKLPMAHEILDFYQQPSTKGPLDPSDMLFDGFGCKQIIQYTKPDGTQDAATVFYLSCKVKKDSLEGLPRMVRHSKFEVYVDSLMFNPSLCDLPNDSLGMNTDSRIGFSFDKRKDLHFNAKVTITSSWINQAMQVYNDQQLGEFTISASIDPQQLVDGVFTYSRSNSADRAKQVSVVGDSFLIPRSYVGSLDEDGNYQDSWGTGQYKVEIQITESCQINNDYYKKDGKWDKQLWSPEWQMINGRKRGKSPWRQIADYVIKDYKDNQWIETLITPAKTAIIQYESGLLNCAASAMPTTAGASAAGASSAASTGAMPMP